jgi:hypothetical protein
LLKKSYTKTEVFATQVVEFIKDIYYFEKSISTPFTDKG